MDSAVEQRIAGALAAFPAVFAAWVFGSMARGEAGPDSDVDVAVLDRPTPGTPSWRRTARYADALVAALPARRVDVVLLVDAPVRLADRILREGRLVLDREPEARCDFEERTLIRYFDDLPMQRAWERDFDAALGERRP